jgi:predicted nucleotidyltransferase component of viral defense system
MLDIDKHKIILIQILKEIYADISISSSLGFKGGTAVYLFYGLPRFSTDLDFDLLDKNKENYILERIEKIVAKFGTIKEKNNKRNTLLLVLSYSEKARNIKIEISKRTFGSDYKPQNYFGIPMLVMTREDMFAHKLVAVKERKKTANRDIFDVWFFLNNNWDVNKEIVEKRTKMNFTKYIEKIIETIEKHDNKRILSEIGELLDEKTKKWAKDNLKKDVIFLLKLRLENK